MLQHARIHGTDDVEKGVVEVLQGLDGADHAGLPRLDHDHLALLGKRHGLFRGRPVRHVLKRGGGREDLAFPVDQISNGERPEGGLRGEEIAETLRPRPDEIDGLVNVLGHAERVGPDDLAMLLYVGGGHVDGVLDDGLGPGGEPVIETAGEGDAGKHRKQNRRHDGDHAEQADDAHMQP